MGTERICVCIDLIGFIGLVWFGLVSLMLLMHSQGLDMRVGCHSVQQLAQRIRKICILSNQNKRGNMKRKSRKAK